MMLFQNDLIPEEAFFNFLSSRKGLLDWVSICGGEPTLQSDIYEFAKKIKNMWFLVKLDTNGRDYHIVKKMIQDGILDYVAVDLKHVPHRYSQAVWVTQLDDFFYNYQKLLSLLLENRVEYEYRTTVIKWMHTPEDIELMSQYIRWVKKYYLQNYIWGNTLNPEFGGTPFSDEELGELQNIAQQCVKKCYVRK